MRAGSKVFLGGTCNGSTWREELKPLLKTPYFDPIVDDWNAECVEIESQEKAVECNQHLYVITSKMTGTYSIAEAVESAHNETKTTFFCVIPGGFSEWQLKPLRQVGALIYRHGGKTMECESLEVVAAVINAHG